MISQDYASVNARLNRFRRYRRDLQFRWFCIGAAFMFAMLLVLQLFVDVGGAS